MFTRVFSGLAFIALGAVAIGIAVPTIITAILCVVAGICILAGV